MEAARRLDSQYLESPTPRPEPAPVRALVVEDEPAVNALFVMTLSAEGYTVRSAASAEEALDWLRRENFDVMLSDVCMPGMSGLDLLERVHAQVPDLPIILLTAQSDSETVRKALLAGAADYVSKPCTTKELQIVVQRNLARHKMAQDHTQKHKSELQHSYETVLDALLTALDTRDTETQGHSERVTAYTMQMADVLGIGSEDLYHIERGALLHDIGKIGVPDRILWKPGPLTEDEWVEMKKHPVIGFRMCARIQFLRGASQIVLHHHERWDGAGYPDGLAGEEIPMGARIFAIADTLDAMTSDRPYRAALPYDVARTEILKHSGTQFDPQVVEAFLQIPPARWDQLRALFDR